MKSLFAVVCALCLPMMGRADHCVAPIVQHVQAVQVQKIVVPVVQHVQVQQVVQVQKIQKVQVQEVRQRVIQTQTIRTRIR